MSTNSSKIFGKTRVFWPAFCFKIFFLLCAVAADQLLKAFIVRHFFPGKEVVLLPFLSLVYAQNTGVAFSLFSSFSHIFLIVFTLTIILGLSYLLFKTKERTPVRTLAHLLIVAGAIGNLIDRARWHYVVDYFYFHIGDVFRFAIFNLADCFITIGTLLLILQECSLLGKKSR